MRIIYFFCQVCAWATIRSSINFVMHKIKSVTLTAGLVKNNFKGTIEKFLQVAMHFHLWAWWSIGEKKIYCYKDWILRKGLPIYPFVYMDCQCTYILNESCYIEFIDPELLELVKLYQVHVHLILNLVMMKSERF